MVRHDSAGDQSVEPVVTTKHMVENDLLLNWVQLSSGDSEGNKIGSTLERPMREMTPRYLQSKFVHASFWSGKNA